MLKDDVSKEPPLGALDLLDEWMPTIGTPLARVQPAEGFAGSDKRTWAWCVIYMDMDYQQAYLLEVRSDDSTYDYLAVFTGSSSKRDAEWYQHPHDIFWGDSDRDRADQREHTHQAQEWFLDWVMNRKHNTW